MRKFGWRRGVVCEKLCRRLQEFGKKSPGVQRVKTHGITLNSALCFKDNVYGIVKSCNYYIYEPYTKFVAVSHVTMATQLVAASLAQRWIIATLCCTEQQRNRSIGYSKYKTNWHVLSTVSDHGITISSIFCINFTGCRYGVGSPSRWQVYAALHLD